MAKAVKQFRYYGEGNTKNSERTSRETLQNGDLFKNYTILQLGIQTLPGTKFYLNEGTEAEINIIEKSSKEELDEEIEDDIEDKPQLEGRVIAKRISELVNSFDVYDKHTGQMRKARYSDMVILLRATKASANCFVEELAKMNIPAFADINTIHEVAAPYAQFLYPNLRDRKSYALYPA
jgi:ATP-dependent exoDNAse (exonuclease V) beta subunit